MAPTVRQHRAFLSLDEELRRLDRLHPAPSDV
jgi:hypothetical protein